MAKSEQPTEETRLTEEQRLELLERSVNLNKIVLFVVGLIIIVALSVSVTITVVRGLSEDSHVMTAEHFRDMQQHLAKLETTVSQQNKELQQLQGQVQALNQSPVGNGAELMRQTLIGQEKSFALFVRNVKNSMHDLANMVPGSRTWLDLYSEALDKVLAQGEKRIKTLQNWPNSAPPATPNDNSGGDKAPASPSTDNATQ